MTTTSVITAIYGGRDRLRTPAVVHSGVEYVCFTDDQHIRHDVWDCRYVPPSHFDPCRSAKRFKVLPHLFVDAERSIWIDANCRLLCDPLAIWDEFDEDLALVRHWRPDIYHEARACRRGSKDDLSVIADAIRHYRAAKHPARRGLWYGTIIFRRRSSAVARFNEAWWAQIERFSRRDQLSLPVVLRRLGVEFHQFGRDQLSRLFRSYSHRK